MEKVAICQASDLAVVDQREDRVIFLKMSKKKPSLALSESLPAPIK